MVAFPQQQGVDLGSAYGRIVIEDNVDQALGRVTRSFDNAISNIGNRIDQVGQTISNVGTRLTVATAPLTAFGVSGVRTASQYEDALKEIEVRAGLTANELASVVEKTKEIGIESQYGPGQAADAFLQLLTTGSSVEEAMQQIDAVIAGASASGEELGFTADALTDVMAGFGLEAGQSAEVMQTLINATSSSSATFSDLVAGYANVGPAARNAGLSVDETAAVLAIFSENGIKGAEAGTQLKTVLTQLQSDRARKELERIGVSLTDMEGNIRPVNDIIGDLDAAMADMTQAERNQSIMELAGSYGQLGLSALLAEGGIDEMTTKMGEQADIGDVAAARMDTFSGSIKFLQGSVELLQITALKPLMDEYLRPIILMIADVVNKVTEWMEANPELAGRIVQVLAVVSALGPVLVIVGQAISLIGGALTVLLSPIGLVIAAISALGFAFATDFMGIRTAVQPVFSWLMNTFNAIWHVMSTFIADIGQFGIEEAFLGIFGQGTLGETMQSTLEGALTMLGVARDDAIAIVSSVWGAVQTFIGAMQGVFATIGQLWTNAQPHLQALGNWFINDVMPQIMSIIQSAIGLFMAIGVTLAGLWTVVQPHLQALADWFLVTGLPMIQSFITDTVLPGIQTFIDTLTRVWTDVSPFLIQLADWFLTTILPSIIAFIETSVIPAVTNFTGLLGDIWTMAEPFLTSLYDWFITTGLPAIMTFIEGPVTEGFNGFLNILSGAWTAVSGGITLLRDNLDSIFTWIKDNILLPVLTTINDIIGALSGVGEKVNQAMSSFNQLTGVGDSVGQLGQIGGAINSGQIDAGYVAQQFGNEFKSMFGFAQGFDYLPQDMLIQAHKGEMLVPAAFNPNNPNATQPMGMGGGGGGNGDTIVQVNIPPELLRSLPDAERNGRALGDEIMRQLQNKGV